VRIGISQRVIEVDDLVEPGLKEVVLARRDRERRNHRETAPNGSPQLRAEGMEARSGSEVSSEAEQGEATRRGRREDALGMTSCERVDGQGCPHCAGREVVGWGRSHGLTLYKFLLGLTDGEGWPLEVRRQWVGLPRRPVGIFRARAGGRQGRFASRSFRSTICLDAAWPR
jgi:hypothetical protein